MQKIIIVLLGITGAVNAGYIRSGGAAGWSSGYSGHGLAQGGWVGSNGGGYGVGNAWQLGSGGSGYQIPASGWQQVGNGWQSSGSYRGSSGGWPIGSPSSIGGYSYGGSNEGSKLGNGFGWQQSVATDPAASAWQLQGNSGWW